MSWRQATRAALIAMMATVRVARELPTSSFQLPSIDEPRTVWELGVGDWELVAMFSLRLNFGHSYRMQPLEKRPRRVPFEPRVGRLDKQEEPIGRRAREGVDVEHRVI